MSDELRLRVRDMFLVQRLTRAEITARMAHRLAAPTVHKYIEAAIKHAEQEGIEIPRHERTGGSVSRSLREPISPQHRTVGVKILGFRVKSGLERQDFADKYDFANRIWVGEMEDGLYDFSLSQLQTIAAILNMSVQDLVTPTPLKCPTLQDLSST